jgi:hypothetical protein
VITVLPTWLRLVVVFAELVLVVFFFAAGMAFFYQGF